MKQDKFTKGKDKKELDQWILDNFFSDEIPVNHTIQVMATHFGMLCKYDFDPKHGFIFTFREQPREKEYYFDVSEEAENYKAGLIDGDHPMHSSLKNMIVEENDDNDNLASHGVSTPSLKVQTLESMIRHNPEKYLKGNLELLTNLTKHPKIIVSKWWLIIPIGFRIIQPAPLPYIDRVKFLKAFKSSLNMLAEVDGLMTDEIPKVIFKPAVPDFTEQKPKGQGEDFIQVP